MLSLLERIAGKCERVASRRFARRPFRLRNARPIITFTFDDFPRSAGETAGPILERAGVAATYFLSCGLLGTSAPTGEIARASDLGGLLARGHELGCHTFHHWHAFRTPPSIFESSILENRRALAELQPECRFRTLSYPIGCPRPSIKRLCARHFVASRGGGQVPNVGEVDLNNLAAFFIEQSRDQPERIAEAIAETCRLRGWLILATHDVADRPTRYGCTPELFADIVRRSVASGAQVLTMTAALAEVGIA